MLHLHCSGIGAHFDNGTQKFTPPLTDCLCLQLMLSKFEYDGKLNPSFRLGEFALPIASISAVNSAASPHAGPAKLVHVSSAGVTRPQRPGIDLEKVLTS